MRRNNVMCVFYNKTLCEQHLYHTFMDLLDDNKRFLKPLYYECDEGRVLIIFYKRKLKKLKNIIADVKITALIDDLLKGNHHICSKCGCGYTTYYPYTYRNNNGCAGRSYECEVCQGYSDEGVRKIKKYAKRNGAKRTLMMLVNDRLFKDDTCENGNEDLLPF